jgi:hypothetical protein
MTRSSRARPDLVDRRALLALVCRVCGASPERRGDRVAPEAVAYTCSKCLMQPPAKAIEAVQTSPATSDTPVRNPGGRPPVGTSRWARRRRRLRPTR